MFAYPSACVLKCLEKKIRNFVFLSGALLLFSLTGLVYNDPLFGLSIKRKSVQVCFRKFDVIYIMILTREKKKKVKTYLLLYPIANNENCISFCEKKTPKKLRRTVARLF